jgi:hypothetical protein
LKLATMWPSLLMKFVPATATRCPADPLDGLSVVMLGGPNGLAPETPPVVAVDPALVEGPGGLPDGGELGEWDTLVEGGETGSPEPLPSEATNATADATTRAPTTTTATIRRCS